MFESGAEEIHWLKLPTVGSARLVATQGGGQVSETVVVK